MSAASFRITHAEHGDRLSGNDRVAVARKSECVALLARPELLSERDAALAVARKSNSTGTEPKPRANAKTDEERRVAALVFAVRNKEGAHVRATDGQRSIKTAENNVGDLRRVHLELGHARKITNFDFLLNTAAVAAAINKIESIPTRKKTFVSAGNVCQALASEATTAAQKDKWTAASKLYQGKSTALNATIADARTHVASEKDLAIYQSDKQLREQWYDKVRAEAEDVAASVEPKHATEAEFMKMQMLVLVSLEFGGTLNPVRGSELSHLWTCEAEPSKAALACIQHKDRNYAVRAIVKMIYQNHKSQNKHGTIAFRADKSWQKPFWEDLALYMPFLQARFKGAKDQLPLFIDPAHEKQWTAEQINQLLRKSSSKYLGVALGSRALRKLFDSSRPNTLAEPGRSTGLEERAKQSLHTVSMAVQSYIKDFGPHNQEPGAQDSDKDD